MIRTSPPRPQSPAAAPAAPRAALILAAAAVALGAVGTAAAGDMAAGRKKAQQCRVCHGIDGIAKIPIAPHLAGESEIYIATQLKAFRSGKRTHEMMSVVAKGLSDEDISDIAAWYSAIRIEATMPD